MRPPVSVGRLALQLVTTAAQISFLQNAKTPNGLPYYEEVDDSKVHEMEGKLEKILEEGFDNKIITKEEIPLNMPYTLTLVGLDNPRSLKPT